jgi:hypothetical protein
MRLPWIIIAGLIIGAGLLSFFGPKPQPPIDIEDEGGWDT